MKITYKGELFDKNNTPKYTAPNGEDVESVLRRDGDAVISALREVHAGRKADLPHGWKVDPYSFEFILAEFMRGIGTDERRFIPSVELFRGQFQFVGRLQFRHDECDYCGTKMISEPGEPAHCPMCDVLFAVGEDDEDEDEEDEDEEDDFE